MSNKGKRNHKRWLISRLKTSGRIPSNLSEYKDCLQWFVADFIEKRDDGLWDKREQKYLLLNANEPYDWNSYVSKEFYVDPDSNVLVKISDFPSKRKTKRNAYRSIAKIQRSRKQSGIRGKTI